MSLGMTIHKRSFYLWAWKWPSSQVLWAGTSPTPQCGSKVFYTPLKKWFIKKDHEILYRRRAKGHLACGWCIVSCSLLCLSFLLDLLSLQATLIQASYWIICSSSCCAFLSTYLHDRGCMGNKIHINPHLYSHSGKYFTAELSGIIINPRNQCPHTNAINSPPGSEMML